MINFVNDLLRFGNRSSQIRNIKAMKLLLAVFLHLLFAFTVLATGQTPDIFIYQGRKYALLDTPLEGYPDIDKIRHKIFGERTEEAGYNTSCWRAYMAEWTLENNQIFLTNIYSCEYDRDSIKSNLPDIFGDLCIDGKVKADWISHELLIADGKMILYHNDGFRYYFEKEKGFFFEKGDLTKVADYDNSKMKKSEFFDNHKLIVPFIYSNIRWDSLPDVSDKNIRVIVTFASGETEKPENITIIRGSDNAVFNEEAKRVVGLLKWNVYYKKGKVERFGYIIPVVFSEEMKTKYSDLK